MGGGGGGGRAPISLLGELWLYVCEECRCSPTISAKPQRSGKQGAQPALDLVGSSELVADGGRVPPPSITDMEEKLRQAEEARKKLRELQEMMVLLQGMVCLNVTKEGGGGGGGGGWACHSQVYLLL